jgi:hypothetical protein
LVIVIKYRARPGALLMQINSIEKMGAATPAKKVPTLERAAAQGRVGRNHHRGWNDFRRVAFSHEGRAMPILIWVATIACMMEIMSGHARPAKEQTEAAKDFKNE